MEPRIAVVFLIHLFSESTAMRFARLRKELAGYADCFVRLQDDGGPVTASWEEFLRANGAAAALVPFRPSDLPQELGYPFFAERQILGNVHFPLMVLARSRPYTHYWQIESDVDYRGNWRDFLKSFEGSDAALLASHIHRHEDWPTWFWWRSFEAPEGVTLPTGKMLKAFMPVFRITHDALAAVDKAHQAGWTGHFEALIPTVLALGGLKVQSLRGVNRCYVGDSQNPNRILPLQSTMRWRPPISVREFSTRDKGPLLFHPVKGNWAFDGAKLVRWPEPPDQAQEQDLQEP